MRNCTSTEVLLTVRDRSSWEVYTDHSGKLLQFSQKCSSFKFKFKAYHVIVIHSSHNNDNSNKNTNIVINNNNKRLVKRSDLAARQGRQWGCLVARCVTEPNESLAAPHHVLSIVS